jgi:hypothetical protein
MDYRVGYLDGYMTKEAGPFDFSLDKMDKKIDGFLGHGKTPGSKDIVGKPSPLQTAIPQPGQAAPPPGQQTRMADPRDPKNSRAAIQARMAQWMQTQGTNV